MSGRTKMEWILLAVGIGVGAGAGTGITLWFKKKEPVEEVDNTATEQQEVIKQLTNLDLIMPICSPEHLSKEGNDDSLCRYLACLQFSRGIDSQTSGSECEQISNIMNKKSILSYCKDEAKKADVTADEYEKDIKECVEFFDRRL